MRRRKGSSTALALTTALAGLTVGTLDVRLTCVRPDKFPELMVEAEVIDQKGYTLRNLEGRHMALYEDDQLLKIKQMELDKDPVSVVLALDASGTMIPATDAVKDTASNLIRLMDPRDGVALLEFSGQPRMLSRFEESRGRALGALNAIVPFGPTALYDGLYRSLLEVAGRSGRRSVVVLTDGRDQNRTNTGPGSRHTEAEVIALAKEQDITIHALAIGPLAMKKELARMAERTGGSAYYAPRPEHLESLYRRILRRLKGRLRIWADTLKPMLDATRRRIDLRVRAGEAYGEADAGYVAPGRFVVDVAPVGWKKGSYQDITKRLVKLKDSMLQELEPGEKDAFMAWAARLFVLPPQ